MSQGRKGPGVAVQQAEDELTLAALVVTGVTVTAAVTVTAGPGGTGP